MKWLLATVLVGVLVGDVTALRLKPDDPPEVTEKREPSENNLEDAIVPLVRTVSRTKSSTSITPATESFLSTLINAFIPKRWKNTNAEMIIFKILFLGFQKAFYYWLCRFYHGKITSVRHQ